MMTETDKDILKFATSFRNGIVGRKKSKMRCYMVCAPLATLLCMNGVACRLIQGEVDYADTWCNHFWIELADGRVLDPTADQFNGLGDLPSLPKVYLGPPSKIHAIATLTPSSHVGHEFLI